MKKAVSSVIAFLKKKKEDFSLLRDSKQIKCEDTFDQAERENEERFSVIRLCKRCVLVYENKTLQEDVLHSLIQKHNHAIKSSMSDIQPRVEETEIALSSDQFQRILRRSLTEICDQYSRLLTSVSEHLLRWRSTSPLEESPLLGPHYPVLIWLINFKMEEEWEEPSTYEDNDQILTKLRFNSLSSSATFQTQLPAGELVSSVVVWALANKFPKQEITLYMEEELVIGYLNNIFEEAFLHIPLSVDKRREKFEAIFRTVDEILDISARVIKTSGQSSDSAVTVKEVIIETATVVTSTAAESTATVGIETAAMALGQAAAGIAISVLVDIALTAGSVTRAKLQRDKGLITNSQFKSTVRRKLCDSGCQFIGGTTGTIVGQVLIPVPVVGAIVGGFFGSLIGVGVSKGIIKTSELIAKAQNARAKAITEN